MKGRMMMKRRIGMVLTLALLGLCPTSATSKPAIYKLGDKMEDFTVALSDGTEFSMYGALAKKKAVLINFWASWCQPCRMEFPYLNQAYGIMSDEIDVIALTTEVKDANEDVEAFKKELGLGALPMGVDANRLCSRFPADGIPLSVMVDRNGVICFMETGAITDKDKFLRLFRLFTSDDYSEPAITQTIPEALPDMKPPAPEALESALGVENAAMRVVVLDEPRIWPFLPAPDGSCAAASNGRVKSTLASFGLEVQAEAGQALGYEYFIDCEPVSNSLRVFVNGEVIRVHGGQAGWTGDYVAFAEAGVYEVTFAYARGTSDGDTSAMLRGLRLISSDETAALEGARPTGPAKTLKGKTADAAIIDGCLKDIVIVQDGAEGESDTPYAVLQSDAFTLRIRVGDGVRDDLACVKHNNCYYMLMNLEQDERGYLFRFDRTRQTDQALPTNVLSVYETLADTNGEALVSFQWSDTEADLDALIELFSAIAAQGGKKIEVGWRYKDGSGRQTGKGEEAPPEGMGRYTVAVTDEAGKPVEGVVLQICDDATCQIATTNADGIITQIAARCPCEIHVHKTPDGYERAADAYRLPTEGGSLTIRLKRDRSNT